MTDHREVCGPEATAVIARAFSTVDVPRITRVPSAPFDKVSVYRCSESTGRGVPRIRGHARVLYMAPRRPPGEETGATRPRHSGPGRTQRCNRLGIAPRQSPEPRTVLRLQHDRDSEARTRRVAQGGHRLPDERDHVIAGHLEDQLVVDLEDKPSPELGQQGINPEHHDLGDVCGPALADRVEQRPRRRIEPAILRLLAIPANPANAPPGEVPDRQVELQEGLIIEAIVTIRQDSPGRSVVDLLPLIPDRVARPRHGGCSRSARVPGAEGARRRANSGPTA